MIIYLEELDSKGKKKFVNVSFWSILKASLVSNIFISLAVYISIFLIGFLLYLGG